MQFAELLIADGGWGVCHQVDCLCGFWEGNDFAQAGSAGEKHYDAVETEGDTAMRRSAILERIEEEAEALFCLFF